MGLFLHTRHTIKPVDLPFVAIHKYSDHLLKEKDTTYVNVQVLGCDLQYKAPATICQTQKIITRPSVQQCFFHFMTSHCCQDENVQKPRLLSLRSSIFDLDKSIMLLFGR